MDVFRSPNSSPLSAVGKTRTGPDRTGPDRTGPDRIDKTRTGSITPENVLEFCAFLSCVVVSSFIETRRKVFFPKGDYTFRSGIMKHTMWRIDVNKRIDRVHNGLLFQTWKLTTQCPGLAIERECQLTMASRIPTILRALPSSTDDPFLLVNQAVVQLSGTRQSKKLLSVFMFEEEDRCVHSQLTYWRQFVTSYLS